MIVPAALRLLRATRASDVVVSGREIGVVSGREIGFGMLAGLLAARVTRRPLS